jgi:hypothetical protein
MPIIIDTRALLRPPFSADEFTATKWDTADAKAQFANKLGKFIAADFKEGLFTNALYSRLSNCFGHIAHYSRNGFFESFFQTPQAKSISSSRPCNGRASVIRPTLSAT